MTSDDDVTNQNANILLNDVLDEVGALVRDVRRMTNQRAMKSELLDMIRRAKDARDLLKPYAQGTYVNNASDSNTAQPRLDMTLAPAGIDAIVTAISTFPWAQLQQVITNHDPADMAQFAADVSSVIAEEVPDALIAAIGFEAIAWMLRNPDINADTNKDPLGRGGRRA